MSAAPNGPAWRGYLALSLIWLSVLGGALFLTRRPLGDAIEILPAPTLAPTVTSVPSPTPGPLHVDVAGAVVAPGVYRLAPGSIVADAITAAGGPATDADLDRLNKAIELLDGAQIYVPRVNQELPAAVEPLQPATPAALRAGSPAGSLVDLNTASAEDLEGLPGIGPALAQAIIGGRPYGSIEDLLRVQGIGDAKLAKLRDYVETR